MTPLLSIAIACEAWKVQGSALKPLLRRAIRATLKHEAITTKYALGIRLVDDAEMQTLNHGFRQKNKPTNVLAFPDGAVDERGIAYLGDIIIAPKVVVAEATDQQKEFTHHLMHLAVHGCLHLLGYDHEKASDATTMEQKEIIILQSLDIENPYQ